MADRWNRPVVEIERTKPTNRIVLGERVEASGDLNSQHRVTTHPAGFRIRERGAIDGTVVHQYRCPVHGVFDMRVERSSVPDEVACAELEPVEPGLEVASGIRMGSACSRRCGLTSDWAGSSCGQGHASGEVMSAKRSRES